MDRRIAVLALASFAMGTEAYVYAGHLQALATDLAISLPAAGQLATAFALTYALTAPVIASLVAPFERRRLIVLGLAAIGVLNIGAVFAPSLASLVAIRVLCGVAAGLVGPIASAAAAQLAPPDQRGRAMAVVLAGMTLAFVLGIPIGSVLGEGFGWRGTFGYAGLLALAAALAIQFILPRVPGAVGQGLRGLSVAFRPEVVRNLSLTLVGFSATFSVIAYVGPVVTRISGLEGSGVGLMQALIGCGAIVGVLIGGRAADGSSAGRVLVVSFLVSSLALASYSALPWLNLSTALAKALLGVAMLAGAAALFTRTPIIQTQLIAPLPEARAVALALNGSMVFFGQGLGAALGGLAISAGGIEAVGLVGGATALIGAALAPVSLRWSRRRVSMVPAG